jgi:hypothetical protein
VWDFLSRISVLSLPRFPVKEMLDTLGVRMPSQISP